MVVLNVRYKVKPGCKDIFYNMVNEEGIPEKSRAEAGNVKYEYFMSVDDDNLILLIEHWKDDDAFEFHKAQEYFKRLQEIKEEYVAEAVVERYEG
ncbi:MAG: putative quinol monooxygenase [Anaerovoracaceae bacterium]